MTNDEIQEKVEEIRKLYEAGKPLEGGMAVISLFFDGQKEAAKSMGVSNLKAVNEAVNKIMKGK